MTKYRHIATILLALAVLFLPYWAYFPAIVLAALFFPFYWEAILLGFAVDALYGSHGSFRTALGAALLIALLLPLRERLRFASR